MPGGNDGFSWNSSSTLFGPSLTTIFTNRMQQQEEERRRHMCLVNDYVNPFSQPWLGETFMPGLPVKPVGNPLSPENVRRTLQEAHFDQPAIDHLAGKGHHPGVNPELALVAARAKAIYEAAHPGKSFTVDQGYRTRQDQAQIAALGSNFTNASGAKGHESPHQFGQAFDFHILERGRNGQWNRQPNERENDNDYKDVAAAMRKAAGELGYGNKLNYGALGDVHVGHGATRHPDWGHIEEKHQFWNQWHPVAEKPPTPPAHHHTQHHHTVHHRTTAAATTTAPVKPK